MLSILLVAAAVALFYGGDLSKFQPAIEWVKKLAPQKWVAIALVLAAVLLMPPAVSYDHARLTLPLFCQTVMTSRRVP